MKALVRLAPTLLLLGATSIPGSAQERSILSLLPTENRSLPLDGQVDGTLSAADFTSPNGAFMEAWALTGETGRSVTIDLVSESFDPVLYVAGPGLSSVLYDDDGGGACNARITFTFLEPGAFRVIVTSTASEAAGTFTLRTSASPEPPLAYGCGELDPAALMAMSTQGQLEVGGIVTGRLDARTATVLEGRPVSAWELNGVAGEDVTITMSSQDFDSYLFAFGPGMTAIQTDDDGAGGVDAQLTLRIIESGRFVIGASALGGGAAGAYALTVARAQGPADLPVTGTLEIPGSVTGALTQDDAVLEGRRSQVWTFEGAAGQSVTVELVSADFDSYLTVVGPGILSPLEDDDSAGDFDARIVFTPAESGAFRIVAASLGVDTGAFELSVR